jgi:hypothetical protein
MRLFVTALILASASFFFSLTAIAQDSTSHNASIEAQLQELNQQVKILQRLRELDQEAAAQKQQASVTSAVNQVKISGVVFGDYFYNAARDTSGTKGPALPNTAIPAASNAKNFNGFQLRRFYLTFDDDLSEKLTTRFRLEDDQIAAVGGTNNLFVKDAYVTWKGIFSGSDLTFGEQPTQALALSEAAWGYRSLEKTEQDLRGYVTTRDLGLSLKGRIDGDGKYNYSLLIGNNSNTAVETDKYKRYYLSLQASPLTNFQIALSGDYAALAPAKTTISDNDKATVSVVAWYGVKESYNIGAEIFSQNAANAPLAGTATRSDVAQGYSVFGSYNFIPELAGVLRYDFFDPNTNSNVKGDSRNLVIAALSWKTDKNFFIQPNIEYETYEDKPAAGNAPSVSYDASLTARLTIAYQF